MKYMDIKEFREEGYLQEVNRLFLHPLGLALEVVVDNDTGKERLGSVWDYRDDPDGIVYEELGMEDAKKAEYISALAETKAKSRSRHLGYVVQPVPGE